MTVVLESAGVRAEVDPSFGARLISLEFGGHEVLATGKTPDGERIGDGCFPMAPWAGRIGGGRIEHDGVTARLPLDDDGNALHGLVRKATWDQTGDNAFVRQVGAPWPQEGQARLRYVLDDHAVTIELSWDDGTDFPCSLGLHPWFLDTLVTGERLELDVDPIEMLERGDRHLPTGRLIPPAPKPWDDCFRMGRSPVLSWPGALSIRLDSTSPWWVVYDEPAHATCVEPQTVPPDAFNHAWMRPAGGWPRSIALTISAIGQSEPP